MARIEIVGAVVLRQCAHQDAPISAAPDTPERGREEPHAEAEALIFGTQIKLLDLRRARLRRPARRGKAGLAGDRRVHVKHQDGAAGELWLASGAALPAKGEKEIPAGDRLIIKTPGGWSRSPRKGMWSDLITCTVSSGSSPPVPSPSNVRTWDSRVCSTFSLSAKLDITERLILAKAWAFTGPMTLAIDLPRMSSVERPPSSAAGLLAKV